MRTKFSPIFFFMLFMILLLADALIVKASPRPNTTITFKGPLMLVEEGEGVGNFTANVSMNVTCPDCIHLEPNGSGEIIYSIESITKGLRISIHYPFTLNMSLSSLEPSFFKYTLSNASAPLRNNTNATVAISVVPSIRISFHSIGIEKFAPSGEVNTTGTPSDKGTIQFSLSSFVGYGAEQPIIMDAEYMVKISIRNVNSNSVVDIIGTASERKEVSRIKIIEAPSVNITEEKVENVTSFLEISQGDLTIILIVIAALAITALVLRRRKATAPSQDTSPTQSNVQQLTSTTRPPPPPSQMQQQEGEPTQQIQPQAQLVQAPSTWGFIFPDGTVQWFNEPYREFGRYDFHIIAGPNSIYISRRHFSIRLYNGRFYIEDLGSSNGTFVNGVDIRGKGPVEITSGDEISLGGYTTFRFVIQS